jgi:transcriptional regulator with XRE-family HTH domain
MMERERITAGQVLRNLRQQRGLTLKQAAAALHTSAPVLSRKERGEDAIERHDIRLAVRSFHLTPWEAYELWTSAGFIPEPALPLERAYDQRELAQALLPNIAFPAFIVDVFGYIGAWNQGIEAIWAPSQAESPRIHVVDDLFSARLRARLGARWEPYVARSLKIFYHKTLRVANQPAFKALLEELYARHGEEFVRKWNEAQNGIGSALPSDISGTIVVHESPVGLIEYLVTQSVFQLPQEYELIVYVPFGADNQERYRMFKATMGEHRLYFGC